MDKQYKSVGYKLQAGNELRDLAEKAKRPVLHMALLSYKFISELYDKGKIRYNEIADKLELTGG